MNTSGYYGQYLPSPTYPPAATTQLQQQQTIIQAKNATSIYHQPTTTDGIYQSHPPPPQLQTEEKYYSTLNFINEDEEVMEIIAEMLNKASSSNYYILPNEPPNIHKKLITIENLRELNKNNILEKLTKFKEQYEKLGSSVFEEKIKANNQNNMKYYRINNDYLTSLTVKLLEVKCFIVSGGTKFALVPNKIGNIEFGEDIQKIFEENLIQPIAEALKIDKPSQGKIWSASMYIDGHKDKQCSLKCNEILIQKQPQFQNECLRQRINLGVQFCPFVANSKEDEVYMGSPLGNIYIKNSKIYGIGRNRIPYSSETFVEIRESPCPVNALISFGLSEIGVFNNKIILYLRNLDSVFYSDVPANNIRNQASDAIKQILLTNNSIRKKLMPKYKDIISKVIDEVQVEEPICNGSVTAEEPPFKRIKIEKKVNEDDFKEAEKCNLDVENSKIVAPLVGELNEEENCINYENQEEAALNFLNMF